LEKVYLILIFFNPTETSHILVSLLFLAIPMRSMSTDEFVVSSRGILSKVTLRPTVKTSTSDKNKQLRNILILSCMNECLVLFWLIYLAI